MKALITGVTGFAGGHLAEHLLSSGDEVLGCSRTGRWASDTAKSIRQNVSLLAWDIRQTLTTSAQVQVESFAPDVIFHLAALSIPAQCGVGQPTPDAVSINVEGTRRVCELARRLSKRPRVLFVSSGLVYGDAASATERTAETHRAQPVNSYAITKREAELVVSHYADDQSLDTIIARTFNHTGPRQLPPLVLPQWCQQLAGGSNTLRVLNPNVWFDLSDVRDVARAYRQLAVQGRGGEIYNLGSGQAVRTGDIAQSLIDLASRRVSLEFDCADEQHRPIADIARLQHHTNWRPQLPLRQTIADTWRFWVERCAAKS